MRNSSPILKAVLGVFFIIYTGVLLNSLLDDAAIKAAKKRCAAYGEMVELEYNYIDGKKYGCYVKSKSGWVKYNSYLLDEKLNNEG